MLGERDRGMKEEKFSKKKKSKVNFKHHSKAHEEPQIESNKSLEERSIEGGHSWEKKRKY